MNNNRIQNAEYCSRCWLFFFIIFLYLTTLGGLVKNTLISLISLFTSCFILFFANGLINVLLPVRMGLDQVNTDTIGLVLSLYFVGMLLGAIYSKNLIKKSGHIRMFAGCVALSAVSILICSLYTDPCSGEQCGFYWAFVMPVPLQQWKAGLVTQPPKRTVVSYYRFTMEPRFLACSQANS